MELFLVQHGEAKPESDDPARPLANKGRLEVTRVAKATGRLRLRVATVHHSGKLRAQQTAEIFAAELGPMTEVAMTTGLAPNDDPAVAGRMVEGLSAPTMLVGHLPHLSRLASLLLVGDPSREIVAFRMGGVVCLVRGDDRRWRLSWMLVPEIVG